MLPSHWKIRARAHGERCLTRPLRIGILLLPPCSTFSIGLVAGPLEKANALAERKLYDVDFYSVDAERLLLPGGLQFSRCMALCAGFDGDVLIVVTESGDPFPGHGPLLRALAELSGRKNLMVGGVHAGPSWLARAGLLDGYRTAVDSEQSSRFTWEFPRVLTSGATYEIDRERFSAHGGIAILDLMLALVAHQHGQDLGGALAREFSTNRMHTTGTWPHRAAPVGCMQRKFGEAIELMKANIEEPLSTKEVARCVGLSSRQLERIFKQHMNTAPSRYYLGLRLDRARHLLAHGDRTLRQIGLSCGFGSASHFSSAYRAHFGVPPRQDRLRAMQHTRGAVHDSHR